VHDERRNQRIGSLHPLTRAFLLFSFTCFQSAGNIDSDGIAVWEAWVSAIARGKGSR
jgi:hypothetical protein